MGGVHERIPRLFRWSKTSPARRLLRVFGVALPAFLVLLIDTNPGIVDTVNPGNTVIFRNARIDMFKETMRLSVDRWGLIEVIEEYMSW